MTKEQEALANSQAFPVPGFDTRGAGCYHGIDGMTLRQYYVGLVMQGLLASPSLKPDISDEDLAGFSVQLADALIAELAKASAEEKPSLPAASS